MKARCLLLITSVLLSIIVMQPLGSVRAQGAVTRNCATVVDNPPPFSGEITFLQYQKSGNSILGVDARGHFTQYSVAPESFIAFHSPDHSLVLFFIREVLTDNILEDAYAVEIWSFQDNQPLHSYQVPTSFRPLQWLGNTHFLFGDYLEEGFVSFAVATGLMETVVTMSDLPDIRAIPIRTRPEYDLAFSPNGQYIAYETWNGEIVIWDIEQHQEIWRSEISDLGSTVAAPAWSSDSAQLAVSLFAQSEMQLFLIQVGTGEQIQITDFSRVHVDAGDATGLHIRDIIWSPDDRFVAFTLIGGLHILSVETMTVTDVCVSGVPVFWIPSSRLLVMFAGSSIQVLDIENYRIYPIADNTGRPISYNTN